MAYAHARNPPARRILADVCTDPDPERMSQVTRKRAYPDDSETLVRRSAMYRQRTWDNLSQLARQKRTSISAELRDQVDDSKILAELAKLTENTAEEDEDSPLTTEK